MPRTGTIRIGTSGWRYEHWRGPFYPDDVSEDDSLAFLAEHLPAVEINRTFYSLPSRDAVRRWRDAAPPGFRFAVKASRYITFDNDEDGHAPANAVELWDMVR